MASLKICVYNYKGGASKTTIVVNLASALAAQGLKVLMIDLDPQCNLTQFWNPADDIETLTQGDLVPIVAAQSLQALSGAYRGTRILSDNAHPCIQAQPMNTYVSDVHDTTIYKMMFALYNDMDATRFQALLEMESTLQACNEEDFKDRLWLMKGSPMLVEFEAEISISIGAQGQAPEERYYKKIGPIAFLMRRLTELHNFDVILIDVGPSNSALNQMSALSCDYILPPCLASLYSCGSISGLLSAVLPGVKGWFGKHALIAGTQWHPEWVADSNKQGLLSWRLPKDPPKLLPILVNNYGVEYKAADEGLNAAKRATRGAGAALLHDNKQIRFGASQFLYTIQQFVKDCGYVEGGDGAAPIGFRGPKVVFESNHGRNVIPFAPSVPVSMPASEALGRPFVHLKLSHFTEFYAFEGTSVDGSSASGGKRKRKSMASNAVKQLMMLNEEASSDSADKVFEREVELMMTRYKSLATWVYELLDQKRLC